MPGILVVEQEASLRRLLSTNLHLRGYTVVTVEDPDTALDQVITCDPDVIILDMPYNANGSRLFLEQLTAHYSAIPIIITTTSHQELHLEGHNIKQVLTKPFGVETFLSAIVTLLEG
jgi:DNA-binding response OmpR family regulator